MLSWFSHLLIHWKEREGRKGGKERGRKEGRKENPLDPSMCPWPCTSLFFLSPSLPPFNQPLHPKAHLLLSTQEKYYSRSFPLSPASSLFPSLKCLDIRMEVSSNVLKAPLGHSSWLLFHHSTSLTCERNGHTSVSKASLSPLS
jgi:hypothetical protein